MLIVFLLFPRPGNKFAVFNCQLQHITKIDTTFPLSVI